MCGHCVCSSSLFLFSTCGRTSPPRRTDTMLLYDLCYSQVVFDPATMVPPRRGPQSETNSIIRSSLALNDSTEHFSVSPTSANALGGVEVSRPSAEFSLGCFTRRACFFLVGQPPLKHRNDWTMCGKLPYLTKECAFSTLATFRELMMQQSCHHLRRRGSGLKRGGASSIWNRFNGCCTFLFHR
jgi:hypothetical protein